MRIAHNIGDLLITNVSFLSMILYSYSTKSMSNSDRTKLSLVGPGKLPPPDQSPTHKLSQGVEDSKFSNLSLAKLYLEKNQIQQAARYFSLAGEFGKAAGMYEMIFDYKNAIINYVKAMQIQTAGDLLIRIGEKKKAARLFEKARKYDLAIKYYKETESYSELMDLFTRMNNFFEAFKIAFKIKDLLLANEFTKKIPKSDPNYVHAHIYLMLDRLDHKDNEKILELFESFISDPEIKFNAHALASCAEILESAGLFKQAIEVYDMLLSYHTDEDKIRNKIQHIEKKFKQSAILPNLQTYHDRFQLYRKLGGGSMSSVFKAKDTLTGEWVALKTFPMSSDDEELLRAFVQEGRTAIRLNHPNITQVHDYGIENDHYFISLEFLEGKTLKEVLAQVDQLNVQNFLAIAIPLTNALVYAHQNHVIHRDIKPANIMLLPNKSVKLMDFGISKITQFSDKSIARGTPFYISPEQILGIQTSKQSDLYSLGVVFYEMLAGKPPFMDDDVLHDHIHKPAEELNKVVLDVPFRLLNLIMSCLAKKPERRPASAQKMLETLELVERELGKQKPTF